MGIYTRGVELFRPYPGFQKKGFTLIELLLVIGVIAILAAVVITAVNPAEQLGDAEDAKRRSDLRAIVDAVYQYQIQHGQLPSRPNGNQWTSGDTEICLGSVHPLFCDSFNLISLSDLISSGNSFLSSIPIDPDRNAATNPNGTNYQITISANGRITATAPLGSDGPISITK